MYNYLLPISQKTGNKQVTQVTKSFVYGISKQVTQVTNYNYFQHSILKTGNIGNNYTNGICLYSSSSIGSNKQILSKPNPANKFKSNL